MSRDFYSFVVVATHPANGVGETAVLIGLPQKTCEGMPITEAIINTTTFSTSVNVEITENTTTFSTLIDSDTTEETTDCTTLVHFETTGETTLVDIETTEKNWNETIPETTKGYCL